MTVTAHENWLKNFAVALSTVRKTKTKEMIINLLLLLLLLLSFYFLILITIDVGYLQASSNLVSLAILFTKLVAVHLYIMASWLSAFWISSDPSALILYLELFCNGLTSPSAYQLIMGVGLPIALQGIFAEFPSTTQDVAGGGCWNWGCCPTGTRQEHELKFDSG